MGKYKYEMQVNKPERMDTASMMALEKISLAPYMQLATDLIGKARHAGGNMFRHQMDTLAILIDYGYINAVLLKASVIHDVVEDIAGFDVNRIINCESDYLHHIIEEGSQYAKILKCADRISNMISLGFVTDEAFIARYCDETELYILPIALEVDYNMYREIINLVITRRKYLETCGYIERQRMKEKAQAQNEK